MKAHILIRMSNARRRRFRRKTIYDNTLQFKYPVSISGWGDSGYSLKGFRKISRLTEL